MKRSARRALVVVAAALFLVMLTAYGIAEAPQRKIKTTGVAKKCLACHGSYDKIRTATEKFKTASGQAGNPHQYIPHNEKTDIPDCTDCHAAHPVPLDDQSKVVKPNNLDWCYGNCHHTSNFDRCSGCH